MRVFSTPWFARYARKAKLDSRLPEIAREIASGRIDVDLGGRVCKQRVARHGAGKSGGHRIIVLFDRKRIVFAYGYPKNKRENIDDDELAAFRNLAAPALDANEAAFAALVASLGWVEVMNDDEKEDLQE